MIEKHDRTDTPPIQVAQTPSPLAALLVDRSLGWDELVGRDFVHAQLAIDRRPLSGAFVLEWTSTAAIRPDEAQPMKIEFIIPDRVVAATTAPTFKSQLVTDFCSSSAAQALEPLRSSFYQALTDQGYIVRVIKNAQISSSLMKTFDSNATFLTNCQII